MEFQFLALLNHPMMNSSILPTLLVTQGMLLLYYFKFHRRYNVDLNAMGAHSHTCLSREKHYQMLSRILDSNSKDLSEDLLLILCSGLVSLAFLGLLHISL